MSSIRTLLAFCILLLSVFSLPAFAEIKPLSAKEVKAYSELSPFELKNTLLDMARKSAVARKTEMLNAGRGNPNFLNTTVRDAFSHMMLFSTELAGKSENRKHLGLRPEQKGIAAKLDAYLKKNCRGDGAEFLKRAIAYAEKDLGMDRDEVVFQMVDAILGDFYPSPPRMLPFAEKAVEQYLNKILFPGQEAPSGEFELFATEGATAAMIYVFKSLRENEILHEGDKIAIITPIFSPYLEIPGLNDFQLVQVHIQGSEKLGWQIPEDELNKLKDKEIKALFMVHPTNPTSISMKKESIDRIADLVKTDRKDLIVLTDTVYATFVDEFYCLIKAIPRNTICVYSFSKYFGVTGWRLGVVMLAKDNVIDDLIKALPEKQKKILHDRYIIDSTTPETLTFMERLVMDSRDVALAHTGGLSCPQQMIMTLFSIFELTDPDLEYKGSIQAILNKRIANLYNNLGIKPPEGPNQTHYYALLNLGEIAAEKHGKDFADYLQKNYSPYDFLFRLADEKQTVCLPGAGFAGPEWSIRVSLANLNDNDYTSIGKNISAVMDEFLKQFSAEK